MRSARFPAPRIAALCATLALLPCGSAAQVEVVVDNDLFGLRGADDPPPDHDYTHGTAVSWDGRGGTRWELGQRIYTPRHDAPQPIAGERPYAGWLYGAWERVHITAGSRSVLRIEAGVTGRPSLAEPVQNGLHRLAGYQRQEGWAHQLPFEPGAVVSYAREHRALALGAAEGTRLEVLPLWALHAGNVRTSAEAGVRARLGLGAGDVWTGGGAARGLSGPSNWGYFSGGGLLTATTLGRIAGESAAAASSMA